MKTVCEPATNNLRPATSSRASPKGFHLLSWPFSNASGSGMHTPTSFRARPNARGLLAGPYGQVVNLRARVQHWHLEGRMPEGFSPANASPLQLPQTRFQIRLHAACGTIEGENSHSCHPEVLRRVSPGVRGRFFASTLRMTVGGECIFGSAKIGKGAGRGSGGPL